MVQEGKGKIWKVIVLITPIGGYSYGNEQRHEASAFIRLKRKKEGKGEKCFRESKRTMSQIRITLKRKLKAHRLAGSSWLLSVEGGGKEVLGSLERDAPSIEDAGKVRGEN